MNIFAKLKTRWEIESNFQVIIILMTFALTGFSTLFVHNQIDHLLGVDDTTSIFIKIAIFVFLVLPIFSVLLFIWGSFLGQRTFVTNFIKYKINLFKKKKN